ncbi:MAG: hypothetical protein WD872_11980 [Pirellulaceae bacterium]
MSVIEPLPDDSDQLFLRSDSAGQSGLWMLIGGAVLVLFALFGFVVSLFAAGSQLQIHALCTFPVILGIGLLWGGTSLLTAPRQVAVGPGGITIEGRTRQFQPWEQVGWATVAAAAMGGRRSLTVYDRHGKRLAAISDAFENFDALADLVKAHVAAHAGEAATRVQSSKSRRSALVTLGTATALLAAAGGIAWFTRAEQRSAHLLARLGVPGEGEIVRRFLAPNGVTPRLEYRVQTPGGDAPLRNAELTRDYWESLEGQLTVPVITVPEDSAISRLMEGEVVNQDFFDTPAGGYGLAGMGALLSLGLLGAGIMQLWGWDIDLDSKTGKLSITRFGAGK